MEEYVKIENAFFESKYVNKQKDKYNEMWENIKNDEKLLNWAITVNDTTLNGNSIAEQILIDYINVPSYIYDKLIFYIFSIENIARIVLDGEKKWR